MAADPSIIDLLRQERPARSGEVDDVIGSTPDGPLMEAISSVCASPFDDSDAERFREVGLALLKRHRFDHARQLFLALVRSPHRARSDVFSLAHTMMAYRGLWLHENQPHPAITVLRMQLALDADDFDAWMNVVNLWLDSPAAMLDRATVFQAARSAVRLRPGSAEAHYALGMLHQLADERRQAIAAYERVLEIDPDHVTARLRIWLSTDKGAPPTGTSLEPPHPGDIAEIDVPADDPDRARAAFRRWGCVILRGALPNEDFDALAGRFEPWLRRRVEEGQSVPVEFREVPEDGRRRLVELLREPAIADRVVQAFGDWGGQGWAPMDNGTWWLQWREPRPQRVGSYHTDYPVHADRSDWFTVWMPFVRCGPGIAPGLNLVPCSLARPILFTDTSDRYVNPVEKDHMLRFFGPVVARPCFQPGDLLVFRSSTVHGTFNDEELPGSRMSFDSRFHLGAAPLGFGH